MMNLGLSVRSVITLLMCAAGSSACSVDPDVARQKYIESGKRYSAEQKHREAVIELRNAVRVDPSSGEARLLLADAYLQTREPLNALREQIRAADLLPADAEQQVKAGNLLLLFGRFEEAKLRASKALAVEASSLPAQILLGNALAGLKDFESAVAEIEEALKLDPDRATTYANLGTLHLANGDRAAAEHAFRQAIEREPRSIAARLALAHFHWAVGEVAKAEQLIRAAIQMAPEEPRAHRVMANILLATDRAAEAEHYLVAAANAEDSPPARIALADYYTMAGRTGEAASILRAIAADSEWTSAANLRLAAIEYRSGRIADAERLVDGLIAADRLDASAQLLKANVLVSRGQLEEAARHVEIAVSAAPRSARPHFALGKINLLRQRPEEAKRAFTEALRVNPRAGDAQAELARLHLAEGAVPEALDYANQAVTNDAGNLEARLTQVRALMASGRPDQAESILQSMLRSHPAVAAVHAQTGLVMASRNDRVAARQHFQRALELDARQLDAIAGLISLDLAAGRPAAAVARATDAVSGAARPSAALVLAGRTYAAVGDARRAEESFIAALQADPGNLSAYESLGRFYVTNGRLPEAERQFSDLSTRHPRPVAALTMLGLIQQSLGRRENARQTYEAALRRDAHAAVAANNLAWLYLEDDQNLDAALQLARTAKAGLPSRAEVADTLGWIFYKRGSLDLALGELEEAVRRDGANPTYRYHLGVVHAKKGQVEEARRSLQTALRLKADYIEAAQLLEEL